MGKFKSIDTKIKKTGGGKNEAQINKLFGKIAERLIEVYVLFYLCIFPLCIHDKYFDILAFRFELFWKPTFVYGIVFCVLGFMYVMCDGLYNDGAICRNFLFALKEIGNVKKEHLEGYPKKGKVNNVLSLLKIESTDIAMTVVIILFSLSTVLSEYPYEAFWGNEGRNQGLLIWLMFYIAYWLVTRFYKFKKWHIGAYMVFASIVCIWGIFNFFLITFGMFEDADDNYKYIFVSSIGNINTYTNFTGILFGVATTMFVGEKRRIPRFFAYVVVVIASFAQIMGMSDNAILSTAIVFIIVPLVIWGNYGNIARYFGAIVTYLSAMKIISMITKSGIHTMNDSDPSVQITLAGKPFFLILMMVITVFTSYFAVKKKKSKTDDVILSNRIKTYKRIWCCLIICFALTIAAVLFMANTGIREELWTQYKNMLIFNDSWGTGRGLCWRLGMEYWRNDASLLMKLFGYGPDTFYIITMDRFMNIMQDAGYGMFDSAHNEYFEYFITVGIFGLTAYLAFLYTSMRDMLRSKNMYSKVFAMGILAYAFQAVVNIAIPITSVVFMMVLFVGISIGKE